MEGSIEKYDCIICIQIIKDMNDESAISLQVHECVTEDFLIGIGMLFAPRVNFCVHSI